MAVEVSGMHSRFIVLMVLMTDGSYCFYLDMEKGLLSTIIAFRRELHQYPEVSYKEFETHKRIKKMLLSFGVA